MRCNDSPRQETFVAIRGNRTSQPLRRVTSIHGRKNYAGCGRSEGWPIEQNNERISSFLASSRRINRASVSVWTSPTRIDLRTLAADRVMMPFSTFHVAVYDLPLCRNTTVPPTFRGMIPWNFAIASSASLVELSFHCLPDPSKL
jgi:hypothetical protein